LVASRAQPWTWRYFKLLVRVVATAVLVVSLILKTVLRGFNKDREADNFELFREMKNYE